MFRANSLLSQWTPGTSASAATKPPLDNLRVERTIVTPAVANASSRDVWGIRVRHAQFAEIFVAGDFNRWKLPDLRLQQWGLDVWETRIALPPGMYQFACYMLGDRGFRRVASDCVECFIECLETPRKMA